MKKLLIILWLGCWALGVAAQEKTVVMRPVKKGEEPKVIVDALKQDFPNSIVDHFSFLPGRMYGEEWNMVVEGDKDVNSDPYLYQVEIRKENEVYTAVYDKQGKLLSSKHVIDNAVLPKEVSQTVKTYKDWHVDKVQEVIEYRDNTKKLTNLYKIKLQQGMKHKNVFISPKGDVVDERIVINIGE